MASVQICKDMVKELEDDMKRIDNPDNAVSRQRSINTAVAKCDALKAMLKSMQA